MYFPEIKKKTFAVSSLFLNLLASQIGEFFLPHLVFHGATSHDTIQRFQSPASEGAASKPATPVALRSENDGQSATSSFDITEMN